MGGYLLIENNSSIFKENALKTCNKIEKKLISKFWAIDVDLFSSVENRFPSTQQ